LSNNRLISTVVATHNRPDFVVRTLQCLARQTYRPTEVIVIDDGSQPDTEQAIAAWRRTCRPNFPLVYLWQPNSGPAVARNRGVAVSSCDLIHFIDDDDIMHPGALESLVGALDTDAAAIAMASYQDRWVSGAVGELVGPPDLSADERLAAMIAGTWFVPIHGYLFTRAAVERIGGWNTALTSQEDDDYLLRAALAAIDFRPAPASRVYYCQHAGVRRATPGKPGESVQRGLEKRLYADLAIRESVYEHLRGTGQAQKYRHAFGMWRERLRDRYHTVMGSTRPKSRLLDWLEATEEAAATTVACAARQSGAAPQPAVRPMLAPADFTLRRSMKRTGRRAEGPAGAQAARKPAAGPWINGALRRSP